jgi:hypothetical protein
MVALAGPMGSLAFNTFDSGRGMVQDGDVWKGLNKMILVKGLRDASKAIEMNANGIYTRTGDEIIGADQVGFGDVAKKFIGLTPSEVSRRYERNGVVYEIDRRLKNKAKELKNSAYKAMRNKDQKEFDKIVEQVIEYNMRFPSYAIDLRASLQSRFRGASKADEYGVRVNRKNYPITQKYDMYSDR